MGTVWISNVDKFGLLTDRPARELPLEAWSGAQNITFHDGVAERSQGLQEAYNTPSVVPYSLLFWKAAVAQYLFFGTDTALWRTDGSANLDVTRASGAYAAGSYPRWFGGVLNGIPFLTNTAMVDVPQVWDAPTSLFVDLPNWPTGWLCSGLRSFKNYLLAFGMRRSGTDYPWELHWSTSAPAGAVPSSWVAAPGNDAGDTNALAGTTDHIVDMLPLGNSNVIYKNNSVWMQQWIGGNQVFAHRIAFNEFGMLTKNCAREVFGQHVVLTQDDVVLHNLVTAKSLVDQRVRRALFGALDVAQADKCCMEIDLARSSILIGIPEVGSSGFLTKLFVWNWKTDTWSIRDIPQCSVFSGTSALAASSLFVSGPLIDMDAAALEMDTTPWVLDQLPIPVGRSVVFALNTKQFGQEATGWQLMGAEYLSTLERTGLPIAGTDRHGEPVINPHSVKLVTELMPLVDADAGVKLSVEVGQQSTIGAPMVWSAPVQFDPSVDTKVNVTVTGKLLGVRFSSTSGARWRLNGYGLTVKEIARF